MGTSARRHGLRRVLGLSLVFGLAATSSLALTATAPSAGAGAGATPPTGPGSISVTKSVFPSYAAGSFTFTLAWSGATCGNGVPGSTQVTLTTPPSPSATHTFSNLQTDGCTWAISETVPTGWVLGSAGAGGAPTCGGGVILSAIVLTAENPSRSCTFADIGHPSITVTKQTEFDLPGTFTFTLSGGQGAGTSPPLSDGQSYTFTGLAYATAYTVVENVPAGWTLAAGDIVCQGGNPATGTPTTNGRILTLTSSGNAATDARRSAQCTFTNRTRSIRVTKQTNPDQLPQTFDLQLRDNNGVAIGAPQTVSDGQTATWVGLNAATYQVTEAVPTGWDLATAPCTGASANAGITNGRSITLGDTTLNDAVCTFTNTKRGEILVTKATDPAGNAGEFPVNLTGPNGFDEDANLVDDGGEHTFLAPPGADYLLTEDLIGPGLPYTLDSIVCTRDATAETLPVLFTVLAGDAITCIVTNDADPGTVTVTKDTDPEGGTDSFPVTLAGPNFSETKQLAGDDDSDSFTLVPADSPYSLTEDLTNLPYTLDSIVCTRDETGDVNPDDFRVLPGDEIDCVVNNDAKPGRVIVTKSTDPAGGTDSFPIKLTGPNAFEGDGSLPGDGGQDTFDPVPVGTGYALDEDLTGLSYDLTSIVCNGTDVTQSTFNVGPGETVNCTVTNDAWTGSVVVTTETDPAGGTGPFPITLAGPNALSQTELFASAFSETKQFAGDGSTDTFTDAPVDSAYSLTENLSGLPYTLESIVCEGVDVTEGTFEVARDEVVECTVTNVLDPTPPDDPGGDDPGGDDPGGAVAPVILLAPTFTG